MQYLRDFNEKTFDQIPRQYVRRVLETNLIAYTVNRGTPEKIIFNIFQRINTGGVNLESQEIRHSLYQGRATRLIKRMAEAPSFQEAIQYAIPPERMLDREYALRYIAFTELNYEKVYKGNIDDYLVLAMKYVNQIDDAAEERIFKGFQRIMNLCHEIFGQYAFRRYTRYEDKYRRSPVNKALFETWSVCLNNGAPIYVDCILKYNKKFIDRYAELLLNEKYSRALKAGDESSVKRRIEKTVEFIEEFCHDYYIETS